MSVARTARRRRKQYAGGLATLKALFGPRRAPKYKKRSADVMAARELHFRQKQKEMAARKGRKR